MKQSNFQEQFIEAIVQNTVTADILEDYPSHRDAIPHRVILKYFKRGGQHDSAVMGCYAGLKYNNLMNLLSDSSDMLRYIDSVSSWGRSSRTRINDWYTGMDDETLSSILINGRAAPVNGWTHRDVLRKAHPRADRAYQRALFSWTCGNTAEAGYLLPRVQNLPDTDAPVDAWVSYVKRYASSLMVVPEQFRGNTDIVLYTLDHTPLMDIVKSATHIRSSFRSGLDRANCINAINQNATSGQLVDTIAIIAAYPEYLDTLHCEVPLPGFMGNRLSGRSRALIIDTPIDEVNDRTVAALSIITQLAVAHFTNESTTRRSNTTIVEHFKNTVRNYNKPADTLPGYKYNVIMVVTDHEDKVRDLAEKFVDNVNTIPLTALVWIPIDDYSTEVGNRIFSCMV